MQAALRDLARGAQNATNAIRDVQGIVDYDEINKRLESHGQPLIE